MQCRLTDLVRAQVLNGGSKDGQGLLGILGTITNHIEENIETKLGKQGGQLNYPICMCPVHGDNNKCVLRIVVSMSNAMHPTVLDLCSCVKQMTGAMCITLLEQEETSLNFSY